MTLPFERRNANNGSIYMIFCDDHAFKSFVLDDASICRRLERRINSKEVDRYISS